MTEAYNTALGCQAAIQPAENYLRIASTGGLVVS